MKFGLTIRKPLEAPTNLTSSLARRNQPSGTSLASVMVSSDTVASFFPIAVNPQPLIPSWDNSRSETRA